MDPLDEENEMSGTGLPPTPPQSWSGFGGPPPSVEEEPLQEGHPDWRPWSGGHASPLEAMWQWMTRQGVGGLKDPEAVRREQEEAEQKAEADRQRVAQQQAQAEKDRVAKAEADRRAADASREKAVQAEREAANEARAQQAREEQASERAGFAAVDAAATADSGSTKIGGGAIHF